MTRFLSRFGLAFLAVMFLAGGQGVLTVRDGSGVLLTPGNGAFQTTTNQVNGNQISNLAIADGANGGNVATVTAANALKVDASGTTLTITGTVSCSNCSGGGGGGTSSSFGAAFPTAGTAAGMSQGGNMVALTGTSNNLNVNLAGNSFGTLAISGTVTANQGGAPWSSNTTQLGGTTIDTNSGTKSAGTQRIVIATDQPQLTNALKVDGSAVTQPVSGTVTANIGTTNGLALDASVTALQVSQGSTTSGQKGDLVQGAVTTGAPSYTTAQTSPLSLTTAGALRVDGSAVTQPVAGTVTANAGTNLNTSALALDASVNGVLVSQGSTTSGEKGPLIQGAVTTNAPSYTTAQTSPLSLDASGLLRASLKDTPSNTNNFNVNIAASAATVTVSGTVTANQGGAPWSQNVTQFGGVAISTGTGASGTGIPRVTVSNDSKILLWDGTNTTAVKAASTAAAAADPSAVVALSPNSPLPSGTNVIGALSANQSVNVAQFGGSAAVTGTGASGAGIPRVTVSNDSNVLATQSTSPWVDNVTQFGGNPVVTGAGASGVGVPRVTVANDSLAQSASAISEVTAQTTSQVLLAASTVRQGFGIANRSNATMLIKYGAGAKFNSYSVSIPPWGQWNAPANFPYRGEIDAIWTMVDGSALVTDTPGG